MAKPEQLYNSQLYAFVKQVFFMCIKITNLFVK